MIITRDTISKITRSLRSTALLLILTVGLFNLASATHAHAEVTPVGDTSGSSQQGAPAPATVIDNVLGNNTTQTTTQDAPATTPDDTKSQQQAPDAPVTNTSPAANQSGNSTSTPAASGTDTSETGTQTDNPKQPVKTDPEYTKKLETVLNQSITPKPKAKNTQKTSTTTVSGVSSPTHSDTTKAQSTPATPAAAVTSPTMQQTKDLGNNQNNNNTVSGAQANSFSPNNYYIPLDNLSPEMTYGMSALAMILGILGAVLIIKDKDTTPQETVAWTPGLTTQEPLLEQ